MLVVSFEEGKQYLPYALRIAFACVYDMDFVFIAAIGIYLLGGLMLIVLDK